MKKALVLAVLGLCLAAPAVPARAAYVTGVDLLRVCQSGNGNDIYACVNYVAGVIDYHLMMQSLGTQPMVDFCMPDSVSIEQAAVAVMEYLKRAPENGSFIAAPAVLMGLQQAYPCAPPRKRKKG